MCLDTATNQYIKMMDIETILTNLDFAMIALDTKGIRWGVERRLEFVELRLYWEGGINRSDIVQEFGVSVPQASKDLTLYQQQAPDNIVYDRSEKRYLASFSFEPKFIALDASAYLHTLAAGSPERGAVTKFEAGLITVCRMPIPQRLIVPDVLRAILAATRASLSIEVLYQSMSTNRPEPIWRRITPHAFASDGLRWHVRAYCHIDQTFKDFILSRCMDWRDLNACGKAPVEDEFWNTRFSVVLAPNPKLNVSQRNVVAQDFAMESERVAVPVRRAMLYYFSKRLRLDVPSQDNPHETPIVVANREAFDRALLGAMR